MQKRCFQRADVDWLCDRKAGTFYGIKHVKPMMFSPSTGYLSHTSARRHTMPEEISTDQAPVEQPSVGQASTEQAPTGQVPAGQAPGGQVPAERTPAEQHLEEMVFAWVLIDSMSVLLVLTPSHSQGNGRYWCWKDHCKL